MNQFTRKTDDFFPLQVKIVGVVLGLAGILVLLESVMLGLLLMLLSVLVLFTYCGVVLDVQNDRYKEFWGLFGFQFGKWLNLPPLQRITITTDTKMYRNQSYNTGLSTYSQSSKTALHLRINDFERVTIAKGGYEDILKDALFLSEQFNLEILDATSTNKKILNPKK
ncbi:MAG: hypothetical protein LPJ89_06860 [Hymenobacteraceae bacterium]|nr:hypothetical protein [Hymenobacteraceae bacterium]